MRFLVVEIAALFISILIIITFFALTVGYVDSVIGTSNEDDLVKGIVVMGVAMGSLFFSVPLAVLVHINILHRFFLRRGSKKDE
jgi:hypothetical protein